jgi:hypothetical protein
MHENLTGGSVCDRNCGGVQQTFDLLLFWLVRLYLSADYNFLSLAASLNLHHKDFNEMQQSECVLRCVTSVATLLFMTYSGLRVWGNPLRRCQHLRAYRVEQQKDF